VFMEIGSILLILGNKVILIKFRMTIKSSVIFNTWFERRTKELEEDLEDELEEDYCTLS
jgi:hypothetical protein